MDGWMARMQWVEFYFCFAIERLLGRSLFRVYHIFVVVFVMYEFMAIYWGMGYRKRVMSIVKGTG